MADEADTQESVQDSSVDETTVDSQSETQTQDSNASSTEQAGESQDGKANAEADQSASTGDKSSPSNQDSKQDSKPVSRRSAAYRISQLVEENKNLKQQLGKSQEQDEWGQPAQDDTQPDIQALVDAAVEKRLNPIVSESSKAADDAELSELFSGNANDRSKYEGQIRSLWNLPQYKDVAAVDLYNMLQGKEMEQRISQAKLEAVEEYKKAEKEAKESSASGSTNISNRTRSGSDLSNLSDKELLERNEKIKAGIKV